MLIMNNVYYMTNESLLLVKNEQIFSPISQLNYQFYTDRKNVLDPLHGNSQVQCIVGDEISFGSAQHPSLTTYADGVDTMQFLLSL